LDKLGAFYPGMKLGRLLGSVEKGAVRSAHLIWM
jgi:hypothetical protein